MSNVMIVEDDLTIADLLQETLEADGYQVTGVARTVKEALELATRHRPDFAVIDIRLANGDLGTTVAAHLRATTNTKIIFSTGNSNNLALMETCGDGVMTKPYNMSDIGRGLRIIGQVAQHGQTAIAFPRNFQLLAHAVT
jgi:DNA-binding response OmpR family regulator